MEWEDIDDNHVRTKVFGGWLVKTYEHVTHDNDSRGMTDGWDWRVAMVFVPDPEHEWALPVKESDLTICPLCENFHAPHCNEPSLGG